MFNENSFFWLSVLANLLQVENYRINLQDLKNTDIFTKLQHQDEILNEQTNIYLKKIIEQNEEILKILKDNKPTHST